MENQDKIVKMLPKMATDELQKIAEKELGETPEVKERTMAELRQILDQKPKFEGAASDSFGDAFLLRFLRWSKFDPEKAFERMEAYFSYSKMYRKFFAQMSSAEVLLVFGKGIFQLSPRINSVDNRLVLLVDLSKWDPKEVNFDQFCRAFLVVLDKLLSLQNFPELQILGLTIVANTHGYGWRHLIQCRYSTIVTAMNSTFRMLPLRISAVYFANMNFFFRIFYNMFYPLFPEKLKSRVHGYGHDFGPKLNLAIDREAQMETLGGVGNSIDIDFFMQQLFPEEIQLK